MRFGYACINLSLPSKLKTCRLGTVEKEGMKKVKELTISNFKEVLAILQWNKAHDILFYRVSSDIVPFGSHPILDWKWWEDEDVLQITNEIKSLKTKENMRLSVHPGQYTVLNSPRKEVVTNAILDLEYHNRLLELVGGTDMILHVGGAYGDKEKAKTRFIAEYVQLSEAVKQKLRLENDDKVFTVADVLDISAKTKVPVCFDIHHHNCNEAKEKETKAYIQDVLHTWEGIGTPKCHISSGREHKKDTAHHDYIFLDDYLAFAHYISDYEVDIMIEAKQKDKALLQLRKDIQNVNFTEM